MRAHLAGVIVIGVIASLAFAPVGAAQVEREVFERFPANTPEEVQRLRAAAEQGDVDAQNDLGLLLRFGAAFYQRSGVEQDKNAAVAWFRRAAAQGLDRAQYNLALCLLTGEGVEKSATEAFMWQSRAAAQGRPQPQYSLGLMYLNGEGVPQNAALGLEWVRKAAAQQLPAALGRLGDAYAAGEGVPTDSVEALKWFTLCVSRANGRQKSNCTVGRDAVSNTLSAQERIEAQNRAAAWLQSLPHR
ncbi:MAG TPA: tetratricopeptide repeat protein [Vicinamibacterales bacterium]|jgi:hypothetical protein